MAVKNATELLALMENTLGVAPPIDDPTPMWKWRVVQAGRIKRKRAKDEQLYSWGNLELAVAYLWKKRQPLESPMGVFLFVKDALRVAAEPEPERPIGELIDAAVERERTAEHPDWQAWVTQLIRSVGSYRKDAYAEWEAERGHLWAS